MGKYETLVSDFLFAMGVAIAVVGLTSNPMNAVYMIFGAIITGIGIGIKLGLLTEKRMKRIFSKDFPKKIKVIGYLEDN